MNTYQISPRWANSDYLKVAKFELHLKTYFQVFQ